MGVRQAHQKERFFKRQSSKLFYWLFKRVASVKLKPGATDFRLIDRSVQQEFVKITERNRITRGLVDWLGYRQAYVKFTARPRLANQANKTKKKQQKQTKKKKRQDVGHRRRRKKRQGRKHKKRQPKKQTLCQNYATG